MFSDDGDAHEVQGDDDLAPVIDAGREPGSSAGEHTTAPEAGDGQGASEPVRRTQLYREDELLIDGVPLEIEGRDGGPGESRGPRRTRNGKGKDGRSAPYGGYTDLGELDRLGMHVALAFERKRLRDRGLDAHVFEEGRVDALVFDVSTGQSISAAEQESPSFRAALVKLRTAGIDPQAPGFDILTLDPSGGIDRLIELKSSGLRATTQDLTFNEWKTARQNELRERFYLYLVGNLRSDLPGAAPFLRMIRDPFGTLWAQESNERTTRRRVKLDLQGFATAHELRLGVKGEPSAVTASD
jgi:hypothetical protein